MQMPRWELWFFLWGQLNKVFWGLCWCQIKAIPLPVAEQPWKHWWGLGPAGSCYINTSQVPGAVFNLQFEMWVKSEWNDSLLLWLSLGHSALLSWGKAPWWDQQPSDKAGDSWGMMELPCAPSWAWGSSQGPAQLDPRRASASSQVCGAQFTARSCSQWIVPALLTSVCWRNKPLKPCQFAGNGSEMIKN